MILPSHLREQRLHYVNHGFDIQIWRSHDIERIFGITYRELRFLELRRAVTPLPRNEKGRIAATPEQVYLLAVEAEIYMRNRLEEFWANGGFTPRKKSWRFHNGKLCRSYEEIIL